MSGLKDMAEVISRECETKLLQMGLSIVGFERTKKRTDIRLFGSAFKHVFDFYSMCEIQINKDNYNNNSDNNNNADKTNDNNNNNDNDNSNNNNNDNTSVASKSCFSRGLREQDNRLLKYV